MLFIPNWTERQNSMLFLPPSYLKFKDIKTAAPGLVRLYVYKDKDGEYRIHNDSSDAEVQDLLKRPDRKKRLWVRIEEVEKKS